MKRIDVDKSIIEIMLNNKENSSVMEKMIRAFISSSDYENGFLKLSRLILENNNIKDYEPHIINTDMVMLQVAYKDELLLYTKDFVDGYFTVAGIIENDDVTIEDAFNKKDKMVSELVKASEDEDIPLIAFWSANAGDSKDLLEVYENHFDVIGFFPDYGLFVYKAKYIDDCLQDEILDRVRKFLDELEEEVKDESNKFGEIF